MTIKEYISKAKELGYSDEIISKDMKIHEEAKKDGVSVPLETFLVRLPDDGNL